MDGVSFEIGDVASEMDGIQLKADTKPSNSGDPFPNKDDAVQSESDGLLSKADKQLYDIPGTTHKTLNDGTVPMADDAIPKTDGVDSKTEGISSNSACAATDPKPNPDLEQSVNGVFTKVENTPSNTDGVNGSNTDGVVPMVTEGQGSDSIASAASGTSCQPTQKGV